MNELIHEVEEDFSYAFLRSGALNKDAADQMDTQAIYRLREHLDRQADTIEHSLEMHALGEGNRDEVWASKARYAMKCKRRDATHLSRLFADRKQAERISRVDPDTEHAVWFRRAALNYLDPLVIDDIENDAEIMQEEAEMGY